MLNARFYKSILILLAAASGLIAPPVMAVVHGKSVNQSQFLAGYPWAVALENPISGGVCTAVLISPTFVLTAAHCTGPEKRVLVGHTTRSRARVIEVAAAIRHPGYDNSTHQFDVGLLRLAEPVRLTPISLISKGEYLLLVKPDAEAEVMGWGKRPGTDFSESLVRADIRFQFIAFRGTYIFYEDQGGPCGGDSGGPLVIKGLDGDPVLVGIASTTDGNLCAKGGGIAAYTNIAAVRKWIIANVPDLP